MTGRRQIITGFSLVQLLLIGFVVVTLPLGMALATAWVAVNHLSSKGQEAALNAVYATQASRNLITEIIDVERHARQYQILSDPIIFESYESQRERFLGTLAAMERLSRDSTVLDQLDQLAVGALEKFETLEHDPEDSDAIQEALDGFPELEAIARAIFRETVRVVAEEVEAMQEDVAQIRQQLLWQASASIPAALVLTSIFTLLIARPMRQLDQAIRALGAGQFDRPIQVTGMHDLTDLGRRLNWLRVRLVELEEQKTFFLHHISHELKTPLSNIVEGAELLSQEIVGPTTPEQREILDIVQGNSLQLQGLIENLLKVSGGIDADTEIARRRVMLDRLIERIVERHKLPARAKELSIELDLQGETLWSDEDRLGTIIDNLLSNAIKFSPASGTVRISTQRHRSDLIIEVSDMGPGIRSEDRERVFERFFQGATRRRGRVRGSGLGLFIAREYARALGGHLKVIESTHGACLQLRLTRQPTPFDAHNQSSTKRLSRATS
ncbi:histidine kinase [Thiocapsa imhoffii]|uniref:histidine kinase n=1 Tax=Thiocapsa imhoffii TaxID=382777 RepID=A0A9X1B988_9GAMM|nr:ATP-binding protein [Thiocapsa imhoffii]MBK1644796.1 histidine kinase [Thiocapsa imhoffii]